MPRRPTSINAMTHPEALVSEDLPMAAHDVDDSVVDAFGDPGAAALTEGGEGWSEDGWTDWTEDSWTDDDGWNELNDWPAPQKPAGAPWFSNPRLLFGLIAVAVAMFVVATVLLITGRAPAPTPNPPPPRPPAPIGPSVRNFPRPALPTEPSEPPPSVEYTQEVQVPIEVFQPPQPSASAPQPPQPSAVESDSPGPRINVTRNPMSFSPEKH